MNLSDMPKERLSRLLGIAATLWQSAWRAEGNKGNPPTLSSLSMRNRRRWFGAALACESLIAARPQETHQQDCIINSCIRALEALKGPAGAILHSE